MHGEPPGATSGPKMPLVSENCNRSTGDVFWMRLMRNDSEDAVTSSQAFRTSCDATDGTAAKRETLTKASTRRCAAAHQGWRPQPMPQVRGGGAGVQSSCPGRRGWPADGHRRQQRASRHELACRVRRRARRRTDDRRLSSCPRRPARPRREDRRPCAYPAPASLAGLVC